MTTPSPTLWQRLLQRLLLSGSLPASWAKRVHAAIAADLAWSRAYHEQRRAERLASFDGAAPRALSPGQADLIEDLVLDAVLGADGTADRTAESAAHGRLGNTWLGNTWLGNAWLSSLAPLSAAAALVVLFVVDGRPPPQPPSAVDVAYRARGSSGGARFGVRVRCLDANKAVVVDEAEAGPRAPPSMSVNCPRGSLLSFGLTNLEADDVYVYAVGVADDGTLRFFSPFDEPSSSLLIAGGTVDKVLDVAADTSAFPKDSGDVAVFTLFSPRPLRGADVARTLRDVQQRTGRVQALDRLPLDALTTRIDLRP